MDQIVYVSGRRGNVDVVRRAARRAGLPKFMIRRGLLMPQQLPPQYRAAIIDLDEMDPAHAARWITALRGPQPRVPVLVHAPTLAPSTAQALKRNGIAVTRVLSIHRVISFFLSHTPPPSPPPRLALTAHTAVASAPAPSAAVQRRDGPRRDGNGNIRDIRDADAGPVFLPLPSASERSSSPQHSPSMPGASTMTKHVQYMTFDLTNVHAFKALLAPNGGTLRVTPRAVPPYQFQTTAGCRGVVVDLDNLHHLAAAWMQALVGGGISNCGLPVLVHGYDIQDGEIQLMQEHGVAVCRRLTADDVQAFIAEMNDNADDAEAA